MFLQLFLIDGTPGTCSSIKIIEIFILIILTYEYTHCTRTLLTQWIQYSYTCNYNLKVHMILIINTIINNLCTFWQVHLIWIIAQCIQCTLWVRYCTYDAHRFLMLEWNLLTYLEIQFFRSWRYTDYDKTVSKFSAHKI